jgi:sugar lactone lactonase YvrE
LRLASFRRFTSNERTGWLILFTVVLFAATSIPVLADPPGVSLAPAEGDGSPPDAGSLTEATEAIEDEEEELAKWLTSPEAAQEREASQDAYAALSAGQAQDLLLEAFPQQLQELNADPARVLSEMEIEKPLGIFGARVSIGNGESAVIESSVPIQSDLGGEGKEPLDLALEPSGDSFVPQNPLAAVELPGSASDPLRLGGGIQVELPASGDHDAELLGDKNLFIPETDIDTDTLVAPIAGGAEVFEQLRSPESPEEFRFPFSSLPEGAKLVETDHGGAEVLSASGEMLEEVPAPSAVDAQGATVPATMSIEGDALVINVAHRSIDVAYPLLLDPRYNEGYESPPLNISWIAGTAGPYGMASSPSSLLAYSQGNSVSYGANTYGQWVYTTSGETTYIENASFSPIYFYVNNCPTAEPHGYVGIWNTVSGAYANLGTYSNGNISNSSYYAGSGGPWVQKAVVGIGTGSSTSLKCTHEMWVGGVTVRENDPEKPTINSVTGVPSGWFDPAKASSATISATDQGMGIDAINIENVGAGGSSDLPGCTGMWNSRCPRDRKWTVAPPYKQGERSLKVSAEDPTGKVGEWSTTTKVDATKPIIDLSGQLAITTAQTGPSEKEQKLGEDVLKLPVYNLHLKATDGNEKVAVERQSGLKNIEIKLDGVKQTVPWGAMTCPTNSCSMEKDFPLSLAGVASGEHKLFVIATDQVGLAREREIDFEYFPATGMKDDYVMQRFPLPDGKGGEEGEEDPKAPELAVNVANGNLVFHQRDIEVNGPAVDLEVERFYNSQLPKAAGSEWGQGWTLAQTPELELAKAEGSPAAKAPMVRTSGVMQSPVALPTATNERRFDAKLQSIVTKKAGGYEVADESGESINSLAFDAAGKVTELRTPGYAKVDYSYEGGDLSEIAVEDPASSDLPPQQLGEGLDPPVFGIGFGSTGSGDGKFTSFGGIATDPAGYIYVADSGGHRVEKFDPDGAYVSQFGSSGAGNGQFGTIAGIGVGPDGSIYVADSSGKRIEKFNAAGEYLTQFGKEGTGAGQFGKGIGGLAVDGSGNVYASDYAGKRVLKFSASGEYVGQIADPQLTNPHAITVNAPGELWAVDWSDQRIEKFNAAGARIGQFSNTGEARLEVAQGIAVDESRGVVWVVDSEEGHVLGYSESGAYLGQFGTSGLGEGLLAEPNWLAVDTSGRFYVANSLTRQVQKWVTPAPPRVTPEAAGSVVETSATLNAMVNPGVLATQYKFEWGPTTAYGNSVPVSAKSIGAGAKTVKVSEKVEGLKPWVLYHFRVGATNAEGTTYSQDRQFTTWGEWSLESPPLPKASTSSSLADISCTSTVNCVAVGTDSYTGRMLGETWNGTKWTLTNGTADQSPTSVSCGSGVSCWGVGTKVTGAGTEVLLERWESEEGEWWRSASGIKPVVPEGATNLRLSGIACTAATECTAVGTYTKEGQAQPLAERLAASKWTVQTMPSLPGATLTDLACSSAGSCVAVGYKSVKGVGFQGVSVRWNGTEWSTLTTPGPKVEGWADQRLTAISCGSAGSCKATGNSVNEEGEVSPYVLSYNGSEFSLATLPTLKTGSSLASMSCTSASACLAVGHAAEGGTLAVGWDGSKWTTRSSLTPKEKTAWLAGVSCVGSLSCTTVGKAVGGGETTPLAERVGEIWTLESPPSPKASNSSGIYDVSCTSALSCVAVGSDGYATRGLGETWDGEKWALQDGTDNTIPTSISCGSAGSCWAVGTQSPENSLWVERWQFESEGGHWERYGSTKPTVFPEGAGSPRLNAISCTSATECTAVGTYTKESQSRALVERVVGSKWTLQTTPEIAGANLSDVSCASATSCLAVGYKTAKGVAPESFSERWNGTEWSALSVPAPKTEEWIERRLTSVACASAGSCVAVGYSMNEEGESLPLAVAYDGNAWSLTTLPAAIKVGSSLASVSCAAAGNCLAVGHAAEGGTLAVGWSGSEWMLRNSPTPKGKTAWLRGVSCLAPMTCTSVGQSTGSGEIAPLADRVELRNQEATTGSAAGISASAATLSATVNPHGLSTKYSFEYGPTKAYGKAIPAPSESAGSGIKDVAVSKGVSGLEAGRLYHYRLVATSEVGITYGQDRTFTTPPPSFAFAFGSQGSGEAQFSSPAGVATDAEGNAYVADAGNHRIVKFDSRGGFVSTFGKEGPGEAQFTTISAITVGPEGYVYVGDSGQRKVKRFKGNGDFVSQFGAEGTGNGQFGSWVGGLAVGKDNVVWVSDSLNHRVERFDSTGKYLSKIGGEGTGNGQFAQPRAIAIDGGGSAWVIDLGNERAQKFSSGGSYLNQFGKLGKGPGELNTPAGLAIDPAYNVWVTDSANGRLQEFNSTGQYLSQFGETGTGEGQFYQPKGLAIDAQGSLLITNDQREIQKWFVLNHDNPVDSSATLEDDPSVEVTTPAGLVESVEGEDVEEISYTHAGQLLTAVDSPEGETKYEYTSERLTKVTLPNGTWGKIEYEPLGRVKTVSISVEGAKDKKTTFSYQDEPTRRTTVSPENEPVITYEIGPDGSVFKSANASKPPEIEQPTGTLWTERGEVHPEPMTLGDKTLFIQGYSDEGIESIQIVANGGTTGSQVLAEKTCHQNLETPGTECRLESKELITNTEAWSPGILWLEAIVTDHFNHISSLRFWVNVPYTPPAGSEAPDPPKFAEVLRFREEFGLDLDLQGNEFALNERIFELISLWHNPNSPAGEVARATSERWGVPLRAVDAAELEYREHYLAVDGPMIEQWAEEQAPATYAGYYIDHRQGGVMRVGFTSNPRGRLGELERDVPLIAGDRFEPFEARPENSIGGLYKARGSFIAKIQSHPELTSLLTGGDVDVRSNEFEIGATNVGPIEGFIVNSFGSNAPIVAVHDPARPVKRKNWLEEGVRARPSGSDRLFAGDWITSKADDGGCTLAFGAYETTGKAPSGKWLFNNYGLTAGHCWGVGTEVFRGAWTMVNGEKKQKLIPIGRVERRSNFHPITEEYQVDSEAISLTSTTEIPKWVYWNNGYESKINGAEQWKPGQVLCYSGAWGGVYCGPTGDTAKESIWGNGEGSTIEIELRAYSECGASGSPVWNPRTGAAIALLIGGPDKTFCKSAAAGPTYVTPILPISSRQFRFDEGEGTVAECEQAQVQPPTPEQKKEEEEEAAEEEEEYEPWEPPTKQEAEELCEEPSELEKAEEGEEVTSIPDAATPGVLGAPTMDSPHRLRIVDAVG